MPFMDQNIIIILYLSAVVPWDHQWSTAFCLVVCKQRLKFKILL